MLETFKRTLYKSSPFLLLGIVFLFFYIPLTVLVVFSFNSRSFPAPWGNFTLDWYHELFQHHELWSSFFNSMIVALSSTLFCLILGIFMLHLLSKDRGIQKWIFLFYGNLVIPETLLGVALITYFSLMNIPLGLFTIIISHSILGLGFMIPILLVRFTEIDIRIFEASRSLGATSLQTFFKITLPLIRPTLIASCLMIFIISFDDFVLSFFCAGTGAQTLSLFLVSSIRYGISPVINAFASIMLIFIILLTSIFFSLKNKTRLF